MDKEILNRRVTITGADGKPTNVSVKDVMQGFKDAGMDKDSAAQAAILASGGFRATAGTPVGGAVPAQLTAPEISIGQPVISASINNTGALAAQAFQMFDGCGINNILNPGPAAQIWNAIDAKVGGTFGTSTFKILYDMVASGVKFQMRGIQVNSTGPAGVAGAILQSGLKAFRATITGAQNILPNPLIQLTNAYQYNPNIQNQQTQNDSLILVDPMFAVRGSVAIDEIVTFTLEIVSINFVDFYRN